MKIKMIYQIGAFYYEAEVENEEERKEAIKGLIYATEDLKDKGLLAPVQMPQSVPENIPNKAVSNQPELASEGQIRYMEKLGIEYPQNCTKIEAIDLINQYKIAHNIPVKGRGN